MNVDLGDFEVMEVLNGDKPVKVNVTLELKNVIISIVILMLASIVVVASNKFL